MKNRFEQIVKLRFGLEDIIPTHPKKEEEEVEINLADYPWDKCIEDQIKAYGDKATAEKVCGAIKAGMKNQMEITPNPCWEGYEPIGLKDDGSPNCVPIKAKQDFVIPEPNSGENEQDYIGRCISSIIKEYDSEGQAYAICKGKWDE